jgi:riboflavin kinase/FMN adenylyltransferase
LKVIITNLVDVKRFDKDTALCLGFFDGVHRGHRSLIEAAKATGLEVAVLTFDRSPKAKLEAPLLTTVEDRLHLFEQLGVTTTLLVIFEDKVKSLSPEDFMASLNRLGVKKVFCGPDFHFGHKAAGDATLLKYGLGRNFVTTIVDEVLEDNQKIASSRIMKHLQYGNISISNRMLGRPYSIKGTVIKGKGNGKKLGYPTANLALSANYVLPLNGVYATIATIGEKRYYSMTSVGYHPTIDPVARPLVEVHIFDFKQKIYKSTLKVEFLQFLRPEITFKSVDDLVSKMRDDETTIRGLKHTLFK